MTKFKKILIASALGVVVLSTPGCFPLVASGVVTGALVAADRRSSEAFAIDEAIEWRALNAIAKTGNDKTKISATSYNGLVLLTGETDSAETRTRIATEVKNLPQVRQVIDRVIVQLPNSLASRANDTRITGTIKASFLAQSPPQFTANHVKVVTERSVVYLLGLVTQQEADAATAIAQKTGGVEKVVTLFDIISTSEAKRLDSAPQTSKKSVPTY